MPSTSAISDGMVVNVGDQTSVIPSANVVESSRPDIEQVKGSGTQRAMINVRGRFIPIIPSHASVGAVGATEAPDHGVSIVVETEGAGRAASSVDAIRDQRPPEIKRLEPHYRSVDGSAGATILGDGRVASIIDVDGSVARSSSASAAQAPTQAQEAA
ncbi:hypothetical protein OY671_008987 [Metschnikowia pulcherrima]|nr:hypothetical protein OY671_008987 [Metschnikowia pulcherrima]